MQMLLLFSHNLTDQQIQSAQNDLGIDSFVSLPQDLQQMFSQVPPDLDTLHDYAQPILDWMSQQGNQGDYVLIQGDFGMTYLLVNAALDMGLIPVYSTTVRDYQHVDNPDGSVSMVHTFRHVRWRRYR